MGAKKERNFHENKDMESDANATPKIALVGEPEVGPVSASSIHALEPKLRDKRIVRKDKIHIGEGVYAKIHTLRGEYRALCLDVTPFEVTLGVDHEEEINEQTFANVQIEIVAPQGMTYPLEGGLTSVDKPGYYGKDIKPLRFAIRQQPFGDLDVARQRGAPLVELPEYLQTQASADDPLYFSEPIYFRIVGFSARGARLLASSRQGALLPGLPLKLSFFLPNKGECLLDSRILRVQNDQHGDRMGLDVVFSHIPSDVMLAISECVLTARENASVDDLRQWGFAIDEASKLVNLTYPKSSKDWCRVLELRAMARQAEDKSTEHNDPDLMLDRFDSFARHVICKVAGHIAGSLRVVFVDRDLARSEYASLGVTIPEYLRHANFVEFSRPAVDSDFDRLDLMTAMFFKAFQLCLKSRKRFVLSHCTPELWPLYKRFGFEKVGRKFSAYGRDDCKLVFLDIETVLSGECGDRLLWNRLLVPTDYQLGHPIPESGIRHMLSRLFKSWRRSLSL